jgi:antitoxin HicB
MKPVYPARFNKEDEGGFFVQFIDIPEAMTDGETMEEAELNAREALSGVLGFRLDNNQEIPEPSIHEGDDIRYIAPDAQVQAAILIRAQRGSQPLSVLARALDTSWPAAKRLEDPHHWPTLKQLGWAAAVMGKRLVLSME